MFFNTPRISIINCIFLPFFFDLQRVDIPSFKYDHFICGLFFI